MSDESKRRLNVVMIVLSLVWAGGALGYALGYVHGQPKPAWVEFHTASPDKDMPGTGEMSIPDDRYAERFIRAAIHEMSQQYPDTGQRVLLDWKFKEVP